MCPSDCPGKEWLARWTALGAFPSPELNLQKNHGWHGMNVLKFHDKEGILNFIFKGSECHRLDPNHHSP